MKYQEYHSVIKEQLERQFDQEGPNIEKAAEYCAASVSSGRVIHVFGCGHSQMFAMEVFYRAGGLVPVNALLIPHLALFPKAKLSTLQERVEGFTGNYLELEDVDSRDTMIIVSISGRNAGVVDMALEAKKIGMKVVALVSKQFAGSTTSPPPLQRQEPDGGGGRGHRHQVCGRRRRAGDGGPGTPFLRHLHRAGYVRDGIHRGADRGKLREGRVPPSDLCQLQPGQGRRHQRRAHQKVQ